MNRFLIAALLTVAAACRVAKEAPDATAGAAQHDHGAMHGDSIVIPAGSIITVADVQFMQGMIAHHAQAIVMSHLAEKRGANPRLLKLAQKIDRSQISEIVLMQEWLRANNQFAPDTSSHRTMTMAGMLTPEQMKQLEQAKGTEFDRLFLELMIVHHQGALTMVADLLASPRAAQDTDVSIFANDVDVVQTAEIATMQQMLADL